MSCAGTVDHVAREQTRAIALAVAQLTIQVQALRREVAETRAEINRRVDCEPVKLRSY